MNPDASRLQNEDRHLLHLILRVLMDGREDGTLTVEPTEDSWRAQLLKDGHFVCHLYEWEKPIVETILACDCPAPQECGRLIFRRCGSDL